MSATSSGQHPVERTHTGYVLGLNLGFHESSAALLHNGSLRWLVEQERLSRRKRALGQSPPEPRRLSAGRAFRGVPRR